MSCLEEEVHFTKDCTFAKFSSNLFFLRAAAVALLKKE